MIKKLIQYIAALFGQEVQAKYNIEQITKYTQLLECFSLKSFHKKLSADELFTIVVFSKDRAIQLDALLSSFYHYSDDSTSIKILYHSSSNRFEKGYQRLRTKHRENEIEFFKERDFKTDLIQIFETISSSKMLFLVDDIFFKNPFNIREFGDIDPKIHVGSLRHGKHLNFAFTFSKSQDLPYLEQDSSTKFLSWKWSEGHFDWAYPLSLDGHLYDTNEMIAAINELDFKAPNSLEEALQVLKPLFKKRKGLCYYESIIVNNPCNKVQVENDNIHGTSQIESLNEKWLNGFRINFLEFKGIANKSAHQDLTFTFIKDE